MTHEGPQFMSKHFRLLSGLFLWLCCSAATAQEVSDAWKFQLTPPGQGWQQPDFDDSDWTDAAGGFGTPETPAARIGHVWDTDSIWLRKSFELESVPANPALLVHHDEDTEVHLNGELVAKLSGYSTQYHTLLLEPAQAAALRVGTNLMAVHCVQKDGGQFIDVHVVDSQNIPKLPKPELSRKPFQSELITKWGAEVTSENAWTEYPRPQLQRSDWTNLNGNWDYAITPKRSKTPTEWNGKILVPFPLESKLSGVQRLLDAEEALWYRRDFQSDKTDGTRTLLNFEAVDYRCEVFVNSKPVGSHVGGNTPFSFDITDAVHSGKNELVVRVEDATEEWQLRGKQTLNARGIWYTQVSGIWQTVWLEEVATDHISDLKIKTDAHAGTISIAVEQTGNRPVDIQIKDGDQLVASGTTDANHLTLTIPNAKLWSPDSPHLYSIQASLPDGNGKILDQIQSYAGIRDVGKVQDVDGNWRFTLNGEIIFHWGPLDQGWWPDGLLTPPSDEAMLFDIEWLKSAGFNMIRKHIKVEPRRYYYHCDRLGMMVWQDQVSGGVREQAWPKWTRLAPNPADATWPAEQHAQFMRELEWMIASLENHPAIVCWVPFNEAWGQHLTMEVGKWTSQRDPTRLVNIASGGNFWPAGDIVDEHRYPHPGFPFELNENGRFDDFIKVIGEFGGHGYPVQGHLWDANRRNWGYGTLPQNEAEYKDRYVTSIRKLQELQQQGIAAGVYTQTTDVEGEINGLMTYDRKVIKISADELAELHAPLLEPTASANSNE
ncbi:glycoside hydrolase family 2 protein [Rhodopirellula sp. P2]|uniref:glycoside hydrolase family 2 protein n=1 Tax=Rhodopirellula sp. P2 TaxID=2127060 RepID=UPI002368256B|nr:sugar-binding domain-containing protein [Rhodopirellula sp. P2]WDQ15096.1 glycoside hydrolase family 2 TIM barrel-domain containing protein [Rhodopirellula sp. P2]